MSTLNPQQLKAVQHEGHAAVVSIPGSGKTTLLVEKVVHILEASSANKVCAVTFTTKAAGEMKARVVARMGRVPEKRLMIKTFNAICQLQVKMAGIPFGKIIPAWKLNDLISKLVIEHMSEEELEERPQATSEMMQLISAIKSNREYIKSGGKLSAYPHLLSPSEKRIFAAYQKYLEQHGYNDFSDQVTYALSGMHEGKIPPLPYTHLLVDEYQDSDDAQVDWVLQHAKNGLIVTVVGDDDQSIYGFRGASGYTAFQEFEQGAVNVERISLEKNYRSHQEILDVADNVISNNKKRIDKKLVAAKGKGGLVEVFGFFDPYEEALSIANMLKKENIFESKETWCILTRTNQDVFFWASVLSEEEIPFRTASNFNMLDNRHAEFLLGLMELSQHAGLEEGVKEVARYYRIDDEMLEGFVKRVTPQGVSALTMLGESSDLEKLDYGSNRKALKAFMQVIQGMHQPWVMAGMGHYAPLIKFASSNLVENHWGYKPEQYSWIVKDISSRLIRYKGSMKQRINMLKEIYKQKGENDEDTNAPGSVIIMTAHGSKGLEFDNVLIPGCVQGKFPSQKAIDAGEEDGNAEDALEEERRLFYVAMTRARKRLVLSFHDYRISPAITVSRYLNLLSENKIEELKNQGATQEKLEQNAETPKVKEITIKGCGPSRFLVEAGLVSSSKLKFPK